MESSRPLLAWTLLLFSSLLVFSYSPFASARLFWLDFFSSGEQQSSQKLFPSHAPPEVKALRAQLQKTRLEVAQLKEQLRSLTQFREKFSFEQTPLVIPATILLREDSSANRHAFKIDRGSQHGVKIGDIVTFNRHLLGRVVEVSSRVSVVLKVTDPAMHIPIVLLADEKHDKNYGEGISIGGGREEATCTIDKREICQGREACRLKFVERPRHFPGTALVVTSGLKGEYPYGLVIGEITEQEEQIGLFLNIKIRPITVEHIHTVLVFSSQN